VAYSEHTLPGRLLKNDPEALAQIYRWTSTTLTSPRFWSLRLDWPDLLQESLSRVVESLRQERFDASRDFRTYVQGIARLVSLQALERLAIRRLAEPERIESGSAVPEAGVIDRQLVRRALDLASDECRELFRLYFFEAKTYQDISQTMDIPIGTVKSRLFRCLECAQRALQPGTSRDRGRGRQREVERTRT